MGDMPLGAGIDSAIRAPASGNGQRWIDNILDVVLGTALLGELIVLFANVILRRLFGFSLLWSQEVAQLALTVLAFVGGAVAYHRDQHMAVEVVVQRLSVRWRATAASLVSWLVFVTAVVATVLSLPMLVQRWSQRTPILGISQTWFVLPLTVGLALLAFFALYRLWHQPRTHVILAGAMLLALSVLFIMARATLGPWPQSSVVLWLSFGVFAALLAVGMPIGFVFVMVSVLYLYSSGAASLFAVPPSMSNGINSFVLLAVPFFILAGYIMTEGGLSRPLAEFARSLIGHVRGGLLQVIVVTMYIFSGISGSKVADIAAVGTTMKDMLHRHGYDPAESVSVLAASAVMGETIPPSIAMLVLGSITSISVGALFIAGLVPAAVMAVCLMLLIYLRARLLGMRAGLGESWAKRGYATLRAVPALLVPIILVGGILAGIATPTEVSSFAVVYALLLSTLGYREVGLGRFWRILVDTTTMSGMLLFIITTATTFSFTLTVAGVPDKISTILGGLGGASWLFMLSTIVALITMGGLLEGVPALLIFGPLLLPIAMKLGIDPLQYGIVLIIAMGIGAFSPPIGVGLYTACAIGNATMEEAARHMMPYLIVLVLGLLLAAFVPWFSLALPNAMHLSH